MSQEAYPDALPAHYRLHWYEVERVLGQGGFGITYLAHDHNLDLQVAIKEYLPADVAQRRSDASVRPRTQPLDERYRWGLARFIEEARTLARFDHPNIVRVQSVFEANDTAYMVMRFEQGENLGTLLDRRGTLPEDELLHILLPVLDGLECVHAAGFIHRDIKPENIHIRSDGSPVLLDFGSARFALGRSPSLTVLVAPGYAPLEQYHGEANTQGPWTDIYGLAATAYRAIVGTPPPDAVLRARGRLGSTADTMVPAASAGQGRYRAALLAAIDHGLQLAEADRPQTMAAWRQELTGEATARPVAPRRTGPTAAPRSQERTAVPSPPPTRPARPIGLSLALGAGAIAVAGGVWLLWPWAPSAPPGIGTAPGPGASGSARPAAPSAPTPLPSMPDAAPLPADPASTPKVQPPPQQPFVKTPPQQGRQPITPPTKALPPTETKFGARPPTILPAPIGSPPESVPEAAPPTPAPSAPTATPTVTTPATAALPSAPVPSDPLAAANEALRQGDDVGAYRLVRALGDTGSPRALEMLGRLTEEGRGTAPSPLQAYIWYGLAVKRGQASARAAADRVASRLQPAEIAQADRVIQRWPMQ